MFKKYLTVILTILIINLACGVSAFAAANPTKEAKLAAKVKVGISKLGTGEAAKIEVKLKDGTKLKGYIAEAANDYFVVKDASTNAATTVAYSNAKQVKGNNLSKGAYIAIGIGIGIGVLVLGIFLATKYAQ